MIRIVKTDLSGTTQAEAKLFLQQAEFKIFSGARPCKHPQYHQLGNETNYKGTQKQVLLASDLQQENQCC